MLRPSLLCPFLGTNYCMNHCEDWADVLWDCTLQKCHECANRKRCLCTIGHLPRPITLPYRFQLPAPNGTTHFLARAEAIPASPTSWLLCDPRQSAVDSVAHFETLYHTYPYFYLYAHDLGILIAGPIVDIAVKTTL